MALNTDKKLRNEVMYCIYVRNHTEEGNFKSVEKDLKRIKDLGTDIIWFMPIYPIGEISRKGKLGSPYAIKDYRKINPEYGTMEDFKHLVDEIHSMGMKCIIDIVYHHTSPDSYLVYNNPEYFYKKADGSMGNKVGEWTDIVDLDYSNKELWNYQIETLKMWSEIVDGFRCDVASLVPVDFWNKARKECAKVKENLIWLAESVEVDFIRYIRSKGFKAYSDSEIYSAFDITYDYDIWNIYSDYLEGKISLSKYVEYLNLQEGIYPDNYIKLRCLENHDRPRIAGLVKNYNALLNYTAFIYFQKGTILIYGGQEFGNKHLPSLFESDKIDRNTDIDLSGFMKKLYTIKKNNLFAVGNYNIDSDNDTVIAEYNDNKNRLVGIFNLLGENSSVKVTLKDGIYKNEITEEQVEIKDNTINLNGKPIIIAM